MKWFYVSYRNYHLIFFHIKSENIGWSSFSSNQNISDDLFSSKYLAIIPANQKISDNFFSSQYQTIFPANQKNPMIFFSNKSENIWWPFFTTNHKISDDLLSHQIRTVFLPCPLPLSHCLQSCWYLVKISLCYPFLQLSINFQQILPKYVIFLVKEPTCW